MAARRGRRQLRRLSRGSWRTKNSNGPPSVALGGQPDPSPRRPHRAAMRDVGGNDEPRHRARASRGVKSSDQSGSPPPGRHNSPEREARHRPSSRIDASASLHSRPRPSSREPDEFRHRSQESTSRRRTGQEDLIPRYREQHSRGQESEAQARRRSRSRGRHSSPSSAKRQRSRSHSPDDRHRKRSKRHSSPSRRSRDHDHESSSKHRRRHSPHDRRKGSPRSHASPRRNDDEPRSRRHRSSRSPADTESRRSGRDTRHGDPDERRPTRSRSSGSKTRQRSTSRHGLSGGDQRSGSKAASVAPSESDRHLSYPPEPPRSPRAHRERGRRRDSLERYNSRRPEFDDDMTSGGGHRGEYHSGHPPSRYHDQRGYSPAPQPAGWNHNSPTHSPYNGNRSGRNEPYPPSHNYPPGYHNGPGNYGPPTGPAAHYHSGPSHSPSYGPPPPQGPYRGGGPRGGGFRGAAFNGRGGSRGSGFKTSQWGSGGPAGRGSHDPNDRRPSANEEHESTPADAQMDDTSNAREGDQPEDSKPQEMGPEVPRGPSGRAPPTGPSAQNSSKFSFAFKPSSKPSPATPKPEISQKFNALPNRRVSLDRSQNDQRRVSLDRSQTDRAPPPSAPREPASARARHERQERSDRQDRPERPDPRNPPEGPRMAPRMRKVKKIMKRPKPRPQLSADLAVSESVFFRKPGNESVVGSGTYGKVFKGLNVYTKGLVALKRIRMEGERDGFPVTAVREIKLLQSLRHPNVVNLQEVMVERNDCFMVFEYLSHDLTGLLNHPTFTLQPAQKKHLAQQMFEGLDYLHNRGVLHRDIKAANILVSNEGILKLADFGLARFYAKHHRLDYTNRVITIWYRSPELLLGETKYSAAVDIWSAACVMVEIFTRQAIFPGDGTELNQLDKIYGMLGTPNLRDWPDLVNMAWFELLKPTVKMKSVFAEKYQDRITPAGFELLEQMFLFDPAKRPNASQVLDHAYFKEEEPLPKQAVELAEIDGDWHEFESKALRKENERKDREARKKDAAAREKDKKRPIDANDEPRDAKRQHIEDPPDPPPAANDVAA